MGAQEAAELQAPPLPDVPSRPETWGLGALLSGICPRQVGAGQCVRVLEEGPVPTQTQGSLSAFLRPLPRLAPSTRRTSCTAWSTQGPSWPASSRATGWASTGEWTAGRPEPPAAVGVGHPWPPLARGLAPQPPLVSPTGGSSSPPILMAGTGSAAGRWPTGWRPCTSRPSARR